MVVGSRIFRLLQARRQRCTSIPATRKAAVRLAVVQLLGEVRTHGCLHRLGSGLTRLPLPLQCRGGPVRAPALATAADEPAPQAVLIRVEAAATAAAKGPASAAPAGVENRRLPGLAARCESWLPARSSRG